MLPGALRFSTKRQRDTALALIHSFRLQAAPAVADAPDQEDFIGWMQVAQHYGLPTRMLDWTRTPAVALYFACLEQGPDGAVFIIDPTELNGKTEPGRQRVLDAARDRDLLELRIELDGRSDKGGPAAVALEPPRLIERIRRQDGTFTLHGSRDLALDAKQAESLVCIRIPSANKQDFLHELDRSGVSDRTLFPEVEYLCRHLVRSAGLIA